jgi:hypothetical protein
VEARAPISASLGAGLPLHLGERLRLERALYLEAQYMPDALVYLAGAVGEVGVADLVMAGPGARFRLDYLLLRRGLRLEAGLELSAGFTLAMVDGQLLVAVPLGATAGLGFSF